MAIEPNNKSNIEDKKQVAATLKGSQRRKRKRFFLLLLLILLIILLGLFAYYLQRKELPLPSIETAETERVPPPNFLFFFDGSPEHSLNRPTDVKVNPQNRRVYVTDSFNERVSVFDRDGNFLYSFEKLEGEETLKRPLYIAFDPSGNVWVTDRRKEAIFVFTPEGEFIKEFIPKEIDRKNWQPNAIRIDAQGNIYVSEIEKNHHIQVFSPDGTLIADIGKSGAPAEMNQGPLLFNFPNGIAFDEKLVFVTDSTNRRIQVLGKKGEFVRIIASGGQPRGIDIGYMDRIHVVDATGHNVLVYDAQGNKLTQFGSVGADRGKFFFPNGIGCDGRRIYVADTWNHRIDVWAWRPTVATPPLARRIPTWWWLLTPLLLLPFLLRRPKNVASRDFLERAIKEEKLHIVKKELKKLYVVDTIFEDYANKEFEDIKMEELLKKADYKERYYNEIKEADETLDDEIAKTHALARRRRRKKRLFTKNIELRTLAEEFKIKTYSFDEFLDAYGYEIEAGENEKDKNSKQ